MSATKYGDDHVAPIVTFGTMAARRCHPGRGPRPEHDLCRGGRGGQAGALGPGALHITLDDALKLSKQLSDLYESDPRVKKLIDTAKALEGMPRHAHPRRRCVVIARLPVYEYVPLARTTSPSSASTT